MRRTAEETRAHVLGVARDLFYRQGIRATGVDEVAAKAGVAPTTLYRVFSSKDDLVGAYVERVDQDFRDLFPAPTLATRSWRSSTENSKRSTPGGSAAARSR